jgi:preprotein translocase subunit SecG
MLSILLHLSYVIVCVFLILVVLLQTGKRADLAGAFGGGGSQTAFGARGAATLLAKVTTGCAVAFMLIALTLSIMSSREGPGGTVLDAAPDEEPAPISAPAAPAEEPGALFEEPGTDAAPPSPDADAPTTVGAEPAGTADDTPQDPQP